MGRREASFFINFSCRFACTKRPRNKDTEFRAERSDVDIWGTKCVSWGRDAAKKVVVFLIEGLDCVMCNVV